MLSAWQSSWNTVPRSSITVTALHLPIPAKQRFHSCWWLYRASQLTLRPSVQGMAAGRALLYKHRILVSSTPDSLEAKAIMI